MSDARVSQDEAWAWHLLLLMERYRFPDHSKLKPEEARWILECWGLVSAAQSIAEKVELPANNTPDPRGGRGAKAMKKQCTKCPWRVDVDPYDIPNGYCPDKHAALADTIATPGEYRQGDMKMMACRESSPGKERPCVGWLSHQLGPGNNIPLRIWAMHHLDAPLKLVGKQHQRFEDTLPVKHG